VPAQASDLDSLITYFRAGVARKPPDILWREWSVDDDRPQVRSEVGMMNSHLSVLSSARKPPDILWREWSVDDDKPQVCKQAADDTLWQHLPSLQASEVASGCNMVLQSPAVSESPCWLSKGNYPLGMHCQLTLAACRHSTHSPAANVPHCFRKGNRITCAHKMLGCGNRICHVRCRPTSAARWSYTATICWRTSARCHRSKCAWRAPPGPAASPP
jgi:hypothetical protein